MPLVNIEVPPSGSGRNKIAPVETDQPPIETQAAPREGTAAGQNLAGTLATDLESARTGGNGRAHFSVLFSRVVLSKSPAVAACGRGSCGVIG